MSVKYKVRRNEMMGQSGRRAAMVLPRAMEVRDTQDDCDELRAGALQARLAVAAEGEADAGGDGGPAGGQPSPGAVRGNKRKITS